MDDVPEIFRREEYVDDAEAHNGWWHGDYTDLETVCGNGYVPRSDLFQLLKWIDGTDDGAIRTISGQTGIGKTVLLHQTIATLVDRPDLGFDPQGRTYGVVDNVESTRLLYLPLEESLFTLETTERAVRELKAVVEYFQDRYAGPGTSYVFLDDLGALDLSTEEKSQLVDLVDDDTVLVATGATASTVSLEAATDRSARNIPMLPMKFVDYVDAAGQRGHVSVGLQERVNDEQPGSGPDERDGFIKQVRRAFGNRDISAGVDTLERLYADPFDEEQRYELRELSRQYTASGGMLFGGEAGTTSRSRVRRDLRLYLLSEVAPAHNLKRADDLFKICALAAASSGQEWRYQEIASLLGVDRRTVDNYLDALGDALILTGSTEYSLRRHRRVRLYLRDPAHVIALSQRRVHEGFEELGLLAPTPTGNSGFERTLARTVAFDHAMRLLFGMTWNEDISVEYEETDAGPVDYVLRKETTILPVVFAYEPYEHDPEEIAMAFDPAVGSHVDENGEPLAGYEAPYVFIVTDRLPRRLRDAETLTDELADGTNVCYLPYWLFLLVG